MHSTIHDINAELKIWVLVLIKTELIYCRSMKNENRLKYAQICKEIRINNKFRSNFMQQISKYKKVQDIKKLIINKANDLRYKQQFDIDEVYKYFLI